jgi:hypothetical protein
VFHAFGKKTKRKLQLEMELARRRQGGSKDAAEVEQWSFTFQKIEVAGPDGKTDFVNSWTVLQERDPLRRGLRNGVKYAGVDPKAMKARESFQKNSWVSSGSGSLPSV